MEKTIGLNMIVRNESLIIKRCLESVVEYISYWTIVDTGSTDSTREIILEFFKAHKIEGKLYERPWVNFEVNRTESLNFSRGKTDYILLIDADMQLVVHDKDWKNKIPYDTCLLKQESGNLSYYNTRLINGRLDYKYTGVTHEFIECNNHNTHGNFDLIYMNDYADGGTRNEKYERDIKLLLDGINKDPKNSRYIFYLANSYRDAGKNEEAIKWYKKRIEYGGWTEEVWNSMLNIGRCYQSIEDWPNALDNYLKAYNYHRNRAEPIYEIAKYYRENNMPIVGSHFAWIGLGISYPENDILFIEKNVYEYLIKYEMSICAYYTNDFKVGRKLCDELILSFNTPDDIRKSCFDNLFFYTEKLQGTTIQELTTVKTKPNYNFCNPSIIGTHRGLFVNIREVSYNFDIQKNIYNYDKTIDTYNHFLELNTGKSGIIDQICGNIKTYDNFVTGLEDIRLFEHHNELWGIGTSRITNPLGINEMVAVKINEDYSIGKIVRLKGYGDGECQKNWVPINYNGCIHFLYSSHPLILLKPNLETGECEVVVNKSSKYRLDNFRGSSQIIYFQDGYLYIVHEVIHRDNRRYYHHRFVYMNKELEIIKISEPFYFLDKTIEYCAGMCQVGNELYITIGHEDKKAYLVKISIEDLNELLNLTNSSSIQKSQESALC